MKSRIFLMSAGLLVVYFIKHFSIKKYVVSYLFLFVGIFFLYWGVIGVFFPEKIKIGSEESRKEADDFKLRFLFWNPMALPGFNSANYKPTKNMNRFLGFLCFLLAIIGFYIWLSAQPWFSGF